MLRSLRFILGGVVAATVAVVVWTAVAERRRTVLEVEGLRADLFAARVSADSCRADLEREQAAFMVFHDEVGSLEDEVRGYEDAEAGGVPGEKYEEYLERFDGFNDSVGVWNDRAGALQESEAACRLLVESHNQISDSLRRRVEIEAGS